MKDGDFARLYDSGKVSGATDIGMHKRKVAYIPLVYDSGRRPMDSKIWRPRRLKMFGLGK
jgi:hypothetical protein